MRIGIDARFFGPIGKGLGRYTEKLIENLERLDRENDYFIFLRKANFDDYKPQNGNFKKVLADYRWYSLAEQIRFPRLLKKYKLDLAHFPHFNVPLFYRGKFVVTIHDLILLHFPTVRASTLGPYIFWFKFLLYRFVIRSALIRAKMIVAVSEFTKKDILENYKKIPEQKILVTYEACEERFLQSPYDDEKILERYGIMKPYLIYVGNAYPHKNLERLVLAFGEIEKNISSDSPPLEKGGKGGFENPNSSYKSLVDATPARINSPFSKGRELKLVLVGNEDYFYRRLKEFVEEKEIKNVIFAGYVPDHDLDTVYSNAEIFVWPSLYEGFGLPPLEAMAKGVPVASSDHPCMKEILGESAYYFNGRKKREIVEALKKVLEDNELRKKLIAGGREQVKKYDWRRMAEKTLATYKKFLK